jgi:CheY-like chemotaxis protein
VTKILYVEDNEDNVYMLSRRLKRKGFEIVVAVDGEQGVEMASSEKPDLILMDLSLPKMDGWTATKRIKSNNDLKSIPIIALSAHAMEEHKQRAIESGCNDYDTKPVDIERLLSKISAQLGAKND